MPCYSPNIRLANQIPNPETGKSQTIRFYNGRNKTLNYEWFDKENDKFKKNDIQLEYQKVPCGWCVGCQERYSKEWAVRCMLEAQNYESNWFLTLTYNDENLPLSWDMKGKEEHFNTETGEIFEPADTGTLRPSDLTKFIKDLRHYWEYHYHHKGIRFYACGEYGGIGERPHYHLILFNMPIPLEKLGKPRISDKNYLWECEEISQIWKKGFITLAEVNWDTCAYVARYIMKKQKGRLTEEDYFENGQKREFVRMSRKPGIGRDFATDENLRKMYENDEIIIEGHKQRIMPARPPSYYDKIYDLQDPERMETIKKLRKELAIEDNKTKNSYSSYSERERLKVAEREKERAWKTLKRNKV